MTVHGKDEIDINCDTEQRLGFEHAVSYIFTNWELRPRLVQEHRKAAPTPQKPLLPI